MNQRNAVMQFIIDTGASITCCRAKELCMNLREQDFLLNGARVKYLNGVLRDGKELENPDMYSVKFYEVRLSRFQIGTSIVLNDVSVWITFDNRFYSCLLGQDLLELLYYLHIKGSKKLFVSDCLDELVKYIN